MTEIKSPINAPSKKSLDREMKVRKHVIEWLSFNLNKKNSTKTALAKACGVTKQSVTNWFNDGRVKPANILAAAVFFGVEPPYELISGNKPEATDPLDYPWRPEFRELIGKLMRDNAKRGVAYTKKARALSEVFDSMTYILGDNTEESIRKSYANEMNDLVRIKHVSFSDSNKISSTIRQCGDFIYLVNEENGIQVQSFVFPSQPSDEKIVTDAIIELSSCLIPKISKFAIVYGDIGGVNEMLLNNMGVNIERA